VVATPPPPPAPVAGEQAALSLERAAGDVPVRVAGAQAE
jgi:hypothetical protein